MTERSRVSAISSACPTQARIACSASSISVISPPRTPRPLCQPKPSTRSVPSLSVRPIRQAILVVPMSSTPNGPVRRLRGRSGSSDRSRQAEARGGACRSCVAPPMSFSSPREPWGCGRRWAASRRLRLGLRRSTRRSGRRRSTVGQRPVEHRVLALQLDQPVQRHRLMTLGQQDVHAVGHAAGSIAARRRARWQRPSPPARDAAGHPAARRRRPERRCRRSAAG